MVFGVYLLGGLEQRPRVFGGARYPVSPPFLPTFYATSVAERPAEACGGRVGLFGARLTPSGRSYKGLRLERVGGLLTEQLVLGKSLPVV